MLSRPISHEGKCYATHTLNHCMDVAMGKVLVMKSLIESEKEKTASLVVMWVFTVLLFLIYDSPFLHLLFDFLVYMVNEVDIDKVGDIIKSS